VYTPITRNKNIKMKLYNLMLLGLMITFVASGLWHGAQWTFIVWGALHGAYLVTAMQTQKWRRETIKKLKLDKSPKTVRWMNISYTFALVCFAYIFFQASSLSDAFHIITHLWTGWSHPGHGVKTLVSGRWAELSFAFFGIAIVMLADYRLPAKGDVITFFRARPAWQRYALCYVGMVSIALFGAFYDTDQKFIYFQF
jgi:D-alanyl-lipoteichoic acid acyltransferase DltB (MBOAT superfamily)